MSFGRRSFSLGVRALERGVSVLVYKYELWKEEFQSWGALGGGVSVLGYKYELRKEEFQSWGTSKRFNWQGYILSASLITCHTL